MKNKKHNNQQLTDTFKVLGAIEKVEGSHFFKHKVLQKLNAKKEENKSIFSWFTPQLQLATLSVVLLLNIGAIFYSFNKNNNKSTTIENFAKEYSLQSDSNSILN